MRITRFRVSGVRSTWNTAYVTGGAQADASDHVAETMRDQVRERFADLYPDATHLREHEWIDEYRCPNCGGEGGGGTMDPDDWFECGPCKGTGRRKGADG